MEQVWEIITHTLHSYLTAFTLTLPTTIDAFPPTPSVKILHILWDPPQMPPSFSQTSKSSLPSDIMPILEGNDHILPGIMIISVFIWFLLLDWTFPKDEDYVLLFFVNAEVLP